MDIYNSIMKSLLWRSVIALALFAAGWSLLAGAKGGLGATPLLLAGLFLMILGAAIVAPAVAKLVAEPSGSLYYSHRRSGKPAPMYSIPEAKRKNGLHQEAFDGFKAIAVEYPQELKAYVGMIDIAIVDLSNRDLAEQVLLEGLDLLKEEHDRMALQDMYQGISSRLKSSAPPRRTLTLDKKE